METFTLDEKTRRPLVQVLVDVALYAFHQGTEAQFEAPETHEPGSIEDCECPACMELFYRGCYESSNDAWRRSEEEVARLKAHCDQTKPVLQEILAWFCDPEHRPFTHEMRDRVAALLSPPVTP